MRTIMFRGKSVMSTSELETRHFKGHDNGWFKGNLVMMGDTPYIVGDFIEVSEEYTINDFWVKVHLESVGQYTGIKDVNGREIYGMDIGWSEHYECCGVVKFEEGKFIYVWENICEDLSEVHDSVEIIGNIYENQDFLEGEE